GIAPNAQITSSSFNNIFPDALSDFQMLNVKTQNHSYGTNIENFYGNLAQAYDQNVFDQPTLLHVFSSGNEGFQPAPAGSGTYTEISNYANLTGNFKMAKNVLTVGCVDTVGNLIYFSSKGPAHDGRVKPEMVAYSTEGSSNSAALVSGVASLLQQLYADNTNGLYPPAALIKAMLLNAAQDVDVPGLDFKTGYGNLDAYRSYKNLNEALYFTDNIEQDDELTFTLSVPSNAQNLKVMLVWTDEPALENANRALVNDLDLKLIAPNGSTTLPWILDSAPDSTSLAKAASRGEDHLNNVEQVTLKNLTAGEYKIIVSGTDISSNTLNFAIAYQWDQKDEFQWNFPTQNDNIPFDGETTSYFRWESTLAASIGSLSYSLDNGNSWITIEEAVDLQRGYHRWLLPEGLTGVAMARICTGTDCYTTETFTLSTLPNLTVGFECGDSVLLSWQNYAQATSYNIYTLNDSRLDSVRNITENFFLFQKSDFAQPYFAVQPVFAGNKKGIRSVTIDYNLLSLGCYINSFYLENQGQAGLNVLLDLGTAYGISEIVIQRSNTAGFVDLGTIADPSPLFLEFLDPAPAQGFNQYRAKLILENGEIIYSELADAYFLSSLAYLVFPNPASVEEGFNVFSKDFSTETMDFELFSSDGKVLLQKTLTTDREFITTKGLAPGIYIYRISTSNDIEINKIILR
ncbi:MAG: S8 family peptidase, partial [Saprospiraceae bacterium]